MIEEKMDVACIGAALVDMVARVERHPEDDDEVFVSKLELLSGGAAANTAAACAKLQLKTAFIGKLGLNDTFGNKIIQDFKEVGVNTSFLKYSTEQGTGSAYVALNSRGDRRIYAHSGAANILTKQDIIEKELKQFKVIFLSSLKNLEPFHEAAIIGKKNDISVILNPGMLIIDQGFQAIKHVLENIDILILSRREFETLMNLSNIVLESKEFHKELHKLFVLGIKIVVITLGKEGAVVANENDSILIPSIQVDNVIDTTGAGDAFSSGFIYGFVQNLSIALEDVKRNAKIGNIVAGKCIQELGARSGIPTQKELERELE